MGDDLFAYIGIKDGSVRAICRDDAGAEKSTAKIIAGWIREGRKVERHPMDEAMRRLKESCAAMGKPTP